MRWRLHALPIIVALGPPLLAGVWWATAWIVAWLTCEPRPIPAVVLSVVAALYLWAATVTLVMKDLRIVKRSDWPLIVAGIGAALAALGVASLTGSLREAWDWAKANLTP